MARPGPLSYGISGKGGVRPLPPLCFPRGVWRGGVPQVSPFRAPNPAGIRLRRSNDRGDQGWGHFLSPPGADPMARSLALPRGHPLHPRHLPPQFPLVPRAGGQALSGGGGLSRAAPCLPRPRRRVSTHQRQGLAPGRVLRGGGGGRGQGPPRPRSPAQDTPPRTPRPVLEAPPDLAGSLGAPRPGLLPLSMTAAMGRPSQCCRQVASLEPHFSHL